MRLSSWNTALHANPVFQGSFRVVGWLLLAAGAIMTFVGCCGCCGAWKMNQCALIGVGEVQFFFQCKPPTQYVHPRLLRGFRLDIQLALIYNS